MRACVRVLRPNQVVSDEEAKVAEAFGVLFQLDEGIEQAYRKLGLNLDEWNPEAVAWKLPLPATYIIAKDGTIKYANMDAVYANRSDPNEVLAEVKRL